MTHRGPIWMLALATLLASSAARAAGPLCPRDHTAAGTYTTAGTHGTFTGLVNSAGTSWTAAIVDSALGSLQCGGAVTALTFTGVCTQGQTVSGTMNCEDDTFAFTLGGSTTGSGQGFLEGPALVDPSKDELTCQHATRDAITRLSYERHRCRRTCISKSRAKGLPTAGCFGPGITNPPAFDLNLCFAKAQDKASGSVPKKCADDCPECYRAVDDNLCATGAPFLGDPTLQFDPTGQLVFCTEFAGGTSDRDQIKCANKVSQSLVGAYIGNVAKCYEKCHEKLRLGQIDEPNGCDAPAPNDPETDACVEKAEQRIAEVLDERCSGVAKPACYGALTGADWVAQANALLATIIPTSYCGF